jgi:hypothetical protein
MAVPIATAIFLKQPQATESGSSWREEILFAASVSPRNGHHPGMSEPADSHPVPPGPEADPGLPLPPPKIPRGQLWACLLAPTLATLLSIPGTLSLANSAGGYDGIPYLFIPLLAGPVAGLGCLPWWIRLMKPRYAGRSLVLLGFAYPIGQMILTPLIGYGGCFAAFAVSSG